MLAVDEKKQKKKAACVWCAEANAKKQARTAKETLSVGGDVMSDAELKKNCATRDREIESVPNEEEVRKEGEHGDEEALKEQNEVDREVEEVQEEIDVRLNEDVAEEGMREEAAVSTQEDGRDEGIGKGTVLRSDAPSEAKRVVPKKLKYQYRMDTVYGDYLSDMVCKKADVKWMDVPTMMIEEMGLSKSEFPEGFPSEDQVRRRITGAKYLLKKKELRK